MGLSFADIDREFKYYPVTVAVTLLCLFIFKYVSPLLSRRWCKKFSLLSEQDTVIWNLTHDSPVVRISCAIVCGFLIFDAIIMAIYYHHIGGVGYFFHHAASIYAYYYAVTFPVMPFFANFRLLAEMSTPFLNLRWYLMVLGYDKSSTPVIGNSVCFALFFFIFRVAAMPVFWLRVYTSYTSGILAGLLHLPYVLFVTCFVLDFLNLYWFHKIVKGAVKLLKSGVASETSKTPARNTKSVKSG